MSIAGERCVEGWHQGSGTMFWLNVEASAGAKGG